MSKYKEIQTEIVAVAHITRALDDLGVPYEVAPDNTALPLYGYQGDRRAETATVVVRRHHVGHLSNDLGWTFDASSGTYRLILSEYDARQHRAMQITQAVAQRCALYHLEALAGAKGFSLNIVDDSDVVRVAVRY